MADDDRIQQAAQFLFEGHKARSKFEPIPDEITPRDEAEAYTIQEAFQKLVIPQRGAIVGYKIALTSAVMQKMVGFDHPCSGAIFASGVKNSPVTVERSDYVRLGAECEIAVQLNADLPASGAPYDRQSVAKAVDAVMPAFELIEDRGAEYKDLFFLGVMADNAWNAGLVLGEPMIEWQDIDLVSAAGEMVINGEPAGEGKGGDALGHPLDALAWLANSLAERGKSLQRDMIVMTGSIVSTKFLNAGDEVSFEIDTLGEVWLSVA
ncbi:MAG: hydratase [Dehalococcoidia bacterium]|nr:hydratase [Dehalococcoidia bacterium]